MQGSRHDAEPTARQGPASDAAAFERALPASLDGVRVLDAGGLPLGLSERGALRIPVEADDGGAYELALASTGGPGIGVLARALRPGGRLLLTIDPTRSPGLAELVEQATRAGLRLLHVEEQPSGTPRGAVFERPDPLATLVAIDGPAGSGTSTLGSAIARALGDDAIHLDTGLLVRVLALQAVSGGKLTRGVERSAVVWRLDGSVPPPDALDAPRVSWDCAAVPDAAVRAEIDWFGPRRLIVSGCSCGRRLRAGARFWLDTPADVRAKRRAVSVGEVLDRDATDRFRGRLLPPDLAAVWLDGRAPIDALVDQALSVLGHPRTRSSTSAAASRR